MKRTLLYFAGAAILLTGVLWLAGRTLYAPSERREEDAVWPYDLGKLRDVPKRYPSVDLNTNAADVIRLAEALEIDLAQEANGPPPPPHPSRPRTLRPVMRKYLLDSVNDGREQVEAPPETLAQFLAEHQSALTAVRAQLNANAPPRWRSDAQDLSDPPRPNLPGHTELVSLLAADALEHHRTGDDGTAWQDLDAIWKLARGLLAQPDSWSLYNALSSAQILTGIAAKLTPPVPLWWRGLVTFDFDRASAAASQYEAWRTLTFTEHYPAGEPDDDNAVHEMLRRGAEVVVGPFQIERAQRTASAMRRRATQLSRTPPCGKRGNEYEPLYPRLGRFTIEREGVAKVLLLQEARLATGAWPSTLPAIDHSQCLGHTWQYSRSDDGTMRLALTPALPGPKHPETRLLLPLEYERRVSP
jgi:hypothetical protein